MTARSAAVANHRHARVAVVQAQSVVVRRHQHRPPRIPRRPDRLARLLRQPPLDLPVPIAAPRKGPVDAHTATGASSSTCSAARSSPSTAAVRSATACRTSTLRNSPADRRSSIHSMCSPPARSTLDAPCPRHPPGSRSANVPIDFPNRCDVSQRRDPPLAQSVHQVRQHRARLYRCELIRVADQHQPGVRPHGLQQPGHHRQRHHRRFIHHDHVMRQPITAMVPEPRRRVRPAAQQPVQRRRMQACERFLIRRRQLANLQLHRLLQPRGRLARRRRQCDPQTPAAGKQGQQPRHCGGLARSRTTGQHREPLRQRDFRGGPLFLESRGKQPVDVGRHLRRPGLDHREDVVADLLLLQPIPVQVQQIPVQPQDRRIGQQRAGPLRRRPDPRAQLNSGRHKRTRHATPAPRTRQPTPRARRSLRVAR